MSALTTLWDLWESPQHISLAVMLSSMPQRGSGFTFGVRTSPSLQDDGSDEDDDDDDGMLPMCVQLYRSSRYVRTDIPTMV